MNNKIKYLVMDVDGTLTDGKIYMGNDGEMMKAFNIKDGYGIHDLLPQAEIVPIIITGRTSLIVKNRCKELGIDFLFQGVVNKVETLKGFLLSKNGLLSEVAYVGDDLNDLPCMKLVKDNGGVIGVPLNSCLDARQIADFVSSFNGGEGAVRDFIDYLIKTTHKG